ncbi:MAG: glycosyl transferase [Candidatus Amesbacteria bacterium GW2011_GWB1_47_19]|nr:MAG: glycosyl transferase [Candidatus Amesbacteria bacterium GW2011_GWA1_44_24]KKU31324.1 MAG: glycosyl transferase [Candidatus Amesbacteria bacterium GW2011_GWC1_46_24]KKU67023.1 MAG: glycosyl transferase [Candidatus Amesbacteria bacterium GW2011_GWB1_47_19]OGD04818.1 MAG: hypothetical protein A2379_04595 [Candidatus Amesbacteria bacterium RIFOXYB1_FULL_47_13]HBC72758.1 hypothetical protein [Candidatus Amesbacteria bacterium]
MKTLQSLRAGWIYLILLFGLITLCWYALVLRGQDAMSGLSWNSRPLTKSLLTVNFGVYDPEAEFSDSDFIAVDHYFLDWRKIDDSGIQTLLDKTHNKNRWLLLTIEPWVEEDKKSGLMEDISAGVYDNRITGICSLINSSASPVLIRFAHEMERVTGRYPWAVSQPDMYISAYRRFVSLCRPLIKDGFFVWSPAGDKGLEKYWPGHEYADYIGLSVYHYPRYEQDNYHRDFSFQEIFSEKFNRIKDFSKPVILAEVGVTGDKAYQTAWLRRGIAGLISFPSVKTLVYFNAQDSPGAWPSAYQVPNWHIDPSALQIPEK